MASQRERAEKYLGEDVTYFGTMDYQECVNFIVKFAADERALAIEECAKIADALGDSAKADMDEFRAIGLSIAAYSEEEMKAYRKTALAIRALSKSETEVQHG